MSNDDDEAGTGEGNDRGVRHAHVLKSVDVTNCTCTAND